MELKTFYCNPLRECCHLVWDADGACVLIDPGCYGDRELQRIKDFVADRALRPVAILLTHGHFDHILGLEDAARFWNVDAWIHPADHEQLARSAEWCRELGLAFKPFTGILHDLSDGETFSFGGSALKVIATPGHTQGCVCFLAESEGVLFSGDTLFAGSIGRTDHPGGDYDQLIASLHAKLLPLDGDIRVLPGHGPVTTIGHERATNPFLQPGNLS